MTTDNSGQANDPVDARDAIRASSAKTTKVNRWMVFAVVAVLGLGMWACTKALGGSDDTAKARSDCEASVIIKLGLSPTVTITPGITSHTGDTYKIGGGVSTTSGYRTFICTVTKRSDGSFNTVSISGL